MNKKSQMFTLIAVALVFLFFVSYEIYSFVHERQAVKTRVKTMESFLFSTEQNLERQLYISGFRIIFLAESEILRTGKYISNFSQFFNEAVFNGTINNNSSAIMLGATIPEIINSIQMQAEKFNLNINFSAVKVYFGQEDPWNIVINFNATLNLTDESDLARWDKEERIKSYISIEGFEDPLYLVSTSSKVVRKINKTIYEFPSSNIADLSLHLENKYYANNSDAPSFLDRLQGINLASNAGIESFVYLPDLSSQGINVYEKSSVDHIYFSYDNPISSKIAGMPDWFRLDSSHLAKYYVS